jgi:surface polysaccharide O-acyltransferase-like enzyme
LAIVFLIPIELYIWLLGWGADGLIAPRNVQTLKFQTSDANDLWGFSHLWFLQYILTYVLVLSIAWEALTKSSVRTLQRVILPAFVGIAIATLAWSPEVVWGFQHSFFPIFSKWVYSGLFFGGGAILWRCDPDLKAISLRGDRLLALGVVFWIASVTMGLWWLRQNSSSIWLQTALAALTVVPAIVLTFGLIGISIEHVHRLGPVMQRLAGASLLIYLLHHPVVGLSHISAKYAFPNAPASVKVIFVSALGVGIGLAADFLWRAHLERVHSANTPEISAPIPFEAFKNQRSASHQDHQRAA